MKVGYIRVSSISQDYEAQHKILSDAGCTKIFAEKKSGKLKYLPALEECYEFMREGDVLCIVRIDRLGRDMIAIASFIKRLEDKKVILNSITQSIDTSTPQGKFILMGLAFAAEMELIHTKERVEEARAVGKITGRKKGLSKEAIIKADKAATLYNSKESDGSPSFSITEISKTLHLSRRTLYNYLKYKGVELNRDKAL